jgi:hypothetical protein
MRVGLTGLIFLALMAAPAAAQSPAATQSLRGLNGDPSRTFRVQRISFERWCQEIQRYPLVRCDARQPEDLRAFESYRTIIERYEVQLLQQREKERSVQERANQDLGSTSRILGSAPAP